VIDEDGVEVEIKDNGKGIPAESIDRIFDMFYRASEDSNGSGLGLYIVKETVEKLKGDIKLKSVFGEGTTINISLPSQPVNQADD
jgi:signal transduction histidine kinase